TVYGGKLVAAGFFDTAGGIPANGIATWDGTTWAPLGSGPGSSSGIFTMCAYDSVLYVAGDFVSFDGKPCFSIAQWNGTTWSSLGNGLKYMGGPGYTETVCIYNGKLYAGGIFDTAGGLPQNDFACWNGSIWDSTGINSLNLNGEIPYSSVVSNGILYLGGWIPLADGKHVNSVVSWNGTLWDSLGSGFYKDTVTSLCVYNNQLYAAGNFIYSGKTQVNYIARWNIATGISSIATMFNAIS